MKADQTVAQRPVTVGVPFQNRIVIANGIAAGETVVTDGQLRLAPGLKVNSTNAPSAAGQP